MSPRRFNRFFGGVNKMAAENSLFICATPRSGSYLLADLLRVSGLPFAEEWFTPFHQSARKKAYGVRESMAFPDFLRVLVERETRDGLFVAKVMWPQMALLQSSLLQAGGVGESFRELFQGRFPSPVFVFLERRDKVRQAISLVKASQNGRWIRKRGSGEFAKSERFLRYTFLGICSGMAERAFSEKRWREFFSEMGVSPLHLVYEDLLGDKAGSVNRIRRELGLPAANESIFSGDETLIRMSSQVNDDWYERYYSDCDEVNRRSVSSERVSFLRGPEAVRCLRVTSVEVARELRLGERGGCLVRVSPFGGESVDPSGNEDGSGWLCVRGTLVDTEGRSHTMIQELMAADDDSGDFIADGLLPEVKKAGDYLFYVSLEVSGTHGRLVDSEVKGDALKIRFCHHPEREKARDLLPGIKDLANSWQYLDWFGYFLDDKFPWIYHSDHEWLYFEAKLMEGGAYHVLDANIGWVEIFPESYPRLKIIKTGQILTFHDRRGDTRTFVCEETNEWITFPTNKPEDLRKLG